MSPLLKTLFLLVLTMKAATDSMEDEHELPYCSVRFQRLCQGKGRHVACQYPDAEPSEYCLNYTKIHFTPDVKHFVTNYINRRRERIAAGKERVRGGEILPKPGLMMLVEWDRELAYLAQRLADQCNFAHDQCRATVRYPYAGQTVGEVRWRRSSESEELTTQKAIRKIFDAWWGERRRAQVVQLMSPFKLTNRATVWGHFGQLAVWTLRAVGCGAVRHGEQQPRLLLVCDFSHTNMLGQRTLVPGPLASCPAHTARRPKTQYPLLCATVRIQMETEIDYGKKDNVQYNDEEDTNSTGDFVYIDHTHSHSKQTKEPYRSKKNTIHKTSETETLMDFSRIRTVPKFLSDSNGKTDRQKGTIQKWKIKSNILKEQEPKLNVENDKAVHKILASMRGRQRTLYTDYWPEHKSTDTNFKVNTASRHRWKHTRNRPKRPGASALLSSPSVKLQSVSSFPIMDKEDEDQLFIDTGFNPNWRKKT